MDMFYSIILWWSLVVSACADNKPRDVLVIGAGASGLAAARNLTNHGGFNVTVLEARPDRYGGRIWTNFADFPNASGAEVDMGASFIHYPAEHNSVTRLHREFELPVAAPKWLDGIVVREKDGQPYSSTRFGMATERVNRAFEASTVLSQKHKTDMSLREALRKSNQSALIDDPLSQFVLSTEEFDFGAPIDNISAQLLNVGYEDLESELDDLIPLKGYSTMLRRLVDGKSGETPLDVRLGKEVTEVKWQSGSSWVKVTCRDGSLFEGDAAIVTLPLGVLKADVVDFIPDLSDRKIEAIKRLGFGVVNKLVLEFDKIFWPGDKPSIGIALKSSADRGKFSLFINFYSIVGRPVLMTFATSYFGKESENWSDRQLKELALSRLRTVFGSKVDNATVVRMARTRWLADPYSRGVYSFPAVGITDKDWSIIGQSVAPLFFAGEHTQVWMYGTVPNALDTGNEAAKELINYLNPTVSPALKTSASVVVFVASVVMVYSAISG